LHKPVTIVHCNASILFVDFITALFSHQPLIQLKMFLNNHLQARYYQVKQLITKKINTDQILVSYYSWNIFKFTQKYFL